MTCIPDATLTKRNLDKDLPESGLIMLKSSKIISFRQYLKLNSNSLTVAVTVLQKVAEEVGIIHEMGLAHGDVSLGRVFITGHDHKVIIIDIYAKSCEYLCRKKTLLSFLMSVEI